MEAAVGRSWVAAFLVMIAASLVACEGRPPPGSPNAVAPSPASTPAEATSTGIHCGTERWAVKTLSDPAAASVRLEPQRTTVDALRSLAAPQVDARTPRISGVETTVYSIQVQIVAMARESDRDIHLVIAEPSDPAKTMIAELPDATCAGVVSSPLRTSLVAARQAFVAACGEPAADRFTNLSGLATLTGVGFFDELHGQRGVAPNGIELHPLLSFESSDCRRR